MDYGNPPVADRLAAEYVLGTLRGPALRRFEALLPAHPALRDAVVRWQHALLPLADAIPPVEPSAQLWPSIEARLFGAAAATAPAFGSAASATAGAPWWQRLAPWRALTGLATAATLVLAVALSHTPAPRAPILVVLAPNPAATGGAQATQARFVASVSPDGRGLVLRPLDAPSLDAGRALELWAVPGQGAPRSLGLVAAEGSTTVLRASLLQNTAAFAVSVEPTGGSPTGAPTGPIISVGKLGV
jgi:anti-sigma-K factor RskA